MHFLSHKKQFWQCQFIGWLFLALTNFVLRIFSENVHLTALIINSIVLFLVGGLCTLGLRLAYLKYKIIEKKIAHMILPVLVCSLLTTIVLTLGMLGLISVIHSSNPFYDSALSSANIISNVIGMFPIVLIWSCIYIGVQSLQRWQQVEREKFSLQLALKEAQLNTLIGQINPHFMFNSLNNIRALMLEDIPHARASIIQLSNIIRHSLNADKQIFIPLEQELKVIKEFVALSGIQYEERLNFTTNIDDDLLQTPIPPMVIQMLVENAIKHGISHVKGGGELGLNIEAQADTLIILVSNPGNLTSKTASASLTNIGLNNIKQRLELQYAGAAHFELLEQQGKVIAKIVIPLPSSQHSSKDSK